MLPESGSDDSSSPQNRAKEELALRLRLLVDAWEFTHEQQLTFPQISKYLEGVDLTISRPRWSYMLNGSGFLVTNKNLLQALANFFEVPASYLLDLTSEAPPEVQAQLTFVQDLRELRVQRFAARNLAGISPDTLTMITSAIRSSREKRRASGEEQANPT